MSKIMKAFDSGLSQQDSTSAWKKGEHNSTPRASGRCQNQCQQRAQAAPVHANAYKTTGRPQGLLEASDKCVFQRLCWQDLSYLILSYFHNHDFITFHHFIS